MRVPAFARHVAGLRDRGVAAVISPLVLLAVPAVIVMANAAAAFPVRAAAHTQPATVPGTE